MLLVLQLKSVTTESRYRNYVKSIVQSHLINQRNEMLDLEHVTINMHGQSLIRKSFDTIQTYGLCAITLLIHPC